MNLSDAAIPGGGRRVAGNTASRLRRRLAPRRHDLPRRRRRQRQVGLGAQRRLRRHPLHPVLPRRRMGRRRRPRRLQLGLPSGPPNTLAEPRRHLRLLLPDPDPAQLEAGDHHRDRLGRDRRRQGRLDRAASSARIPRTASPGRGGGLVRRPEGGGLARRLLARPRWTPSDRSPRPRSTAGRSPYRPCAEATSRPVNEPQVITKVGADRRDGRSRRAPGSGAGTIPTGSRIAAIVRIRIERRSSGAGHHS